MGIGIGMDVGGSDFQDFRSDLSVSGALKFGEQITSSTSALCFNTFLDFMMRTIVHSK